MGGTVEIPVWLLVLGGLAACVAVLDRVVGPWIKWYFRRRLLRAVDRLNKRLPVPIQPFKLMRRRALIDRLTYDPEVMRAAEEHIAETDKPRELVMLQVERYARETVPGFSAALYFAVGARISRFVSKTLYRVRLGYFDRQALSAVEPDAAVVFVMNHRSNVDYLLVTWLVSTSTALSYAVGEWARVWPLSPIIRAMGAYFIRRRSRDGLYRAVLRRYVQMATEGGVAQAIFPEGGLSRTGALGPPKLGLISYIVDGWRPGGRDVVFVPVGLNYDRVIEDRILIGAEQAKDGGARFNVSVPRAIWATLKIVANRATGRYRRFGYACVSFGAPLSLAEFMADHIGDAAPTEALGEAIAERIGAVVPILPTPLVATVFADAAGAALPRDEVDARVADLAARLKEDGAHLRLPRGDVAAASKFGLRMLMVRGLIVEADDGALCAAPDAGPILDFYAGSIRHLVRAATGEGPDPDPRAR